MAIGLVNYTVRKGVSSFLAIARHLYTFHYWQESMGIAGDSYLKVEWREILEVQTNAHLEDRSRAQLYCVCLTHIRSCHWSTSPQKEQARKQTQSFLSIVSNSLGLHNLLELAFVICVYLINISESLRN